MGEWTKERIEAAEKRCEKATDGPWLGDEDIAYDIVDSHGEAIADVWSGTDDTVFIAAARTDLPDALAEIKAAAVALDAEISRSDKAADRPYSLAERIEFVIAGLDREARRGDCAEDEVKRLTLRIQGLEQANREAHQAIAKSKAHIDAADRRGDHAAQDRDTYKRERDEAKTELARVLAHIATLPAWCAPIPPPGLRPAALGGECARCLARPGYHEGSSAQVTEDVVGHALTVASGAQAVTSVAVASRESRLHALFEKFMPMLLEEQTRGELGITCPCGATATDYTVDGLNSKPVCADFPRCKSRASVRATDEHVGHRTSTEAHKALRSTLEGLHGLIPEHAFDALHEAVRDVENAHIV